MSEEKKVFFFFEASSNMLEKTFQLFSTLKLGDLVSGQILYWLIWD
jgi:hypothetical protein